MNPRIDKLRNAFREQGADAFLTEHPVNRTYVSGFTGSTGSVLITADEAVFVTDFRYTDQAADEAKGFKVVNNDRRNVPTLYEELKRMGVKKLAVEASHISLASYETWRNAFDGIELVPTTGLIETLRTYKDEAELAIMREAARIADEAYSHILTYIKPGMRELDVAMELEFFMRKQGATGAAFDIIVASGHRGALPHGRASEKVIEKGDMVTLDFGAAYKGYNSDLTRTFAVGEPDPKMVEIYNIVLQAQLNCVNNLKPGVNTKDADALTRDIITDAGYGAEYGHSTGHGLGVDVHELPNLSATAVPVTLEPGMVVTVEPGIYVSGLGGVRIEDDVVITENGIEILTKSTKELLILSV
ncbi:M24 family metallopeptidase [Brevibacillus dissolubilis]|uniref:M24 family metallopeptidase n=1 Tax=Brevibacillus dissolubilis TaxID=1844116 RepID=UPI00111603E0|nr:Xaa-Pro peptidase family protein [Brevibacillus dissolubilis]